MALNKEKIFRSLSVGTADSITVESEVKVMDGDTLIVSNYITNSLQPYAIVDGVVVEVDVSEEDELVQKVAAKLWTKSVKDSVKEALDAMVAG